mmetsp:Transcript_28689/g.84561  ORF Transcript_28689/g.84561 Transcript_28689/m.84561 type:complete len:520 (-) Transcript_28689:262-1821(-)
MSPPMSSSIPFPFRSSPSVESSGGTTAAVSNTVSYKRRTVSGANKIPSLSDGGGSTVRRSAEVNLRDRDAGGRGDDEHVYRRKSRASVTSLSYRAPDDGRTGWTVGGRSGSAAPPPSSSAAAERTDQSSSCGGGRFPGQSSENGGMPSPLSFETFQAGRHSHGGAPDAAAAAGSFDQPPSSPPPTRSYHSPHKTPQRDVADAAPNGGASTGNSPAPLYVVEKRQKKVSRVAQTYAFEDYWSILGQIVDGCACMNLSPCSVQGYRDQVATSPGASFDQSPAQQKQTGDGGTNAYASFEQGRGSPPSASNTANDADVVESPCRTPSQGGGEPFMASSIQGGLSSHRELGRVVAADLSMLFQEEKEDEEDSSGQGQRHSQDISKSSAPIAEVPSDDEGDSSRQRSQEIFHSSPSRLDAEDDTEQSPRRPPTIFRSSVPPRLDAVGGSTACYVVHKKERVSSIFRNDTETSGENGSGNAAVDAIYSREAVEVQEGCGRDVGAADAISVSTAMARHPYMYVRRS